MKIALVGYGKMGKAIDAIAQERQHQVVARLEETPTAENLNQADIVIEFSKPEAAFKNISSSLNLSVPVVCGTTGWLNDKPKVEALAKEKDTAFLYASNFSLGVNLFFALNKKLAGMMQPFSQYNVQLEETHHIHKKDAPSGTGITLAEGIIENSHFEAWKEAETEGNRLGIISLREDEVPGTHRVMYRSEVDEIEIKHTAFSRKGFALGAVIAAEWLVDKKGVFEMNDVLGL